MNEVSARPRTLRNGSIVSGDSPEYFLAIGKTFSLMARCQECTSWSIKFQKSTGRHFSASSLSVRLLLDDGPTRATLFTGWVMHLNVERTGIRVASPEFIDSGVPLKSNLILLDNRLQWADTSDYETPIQSCLPETPCHPCIVQIELSTSREHKASHSPKVPSKDTYVINSVGVAASPLPGTINSSTVSFSSTNFLSLTCSFCPATQTLSSNFPLFCPSSCLKGHAGFKHGLNLHIVLT